MPNENIVDAVPADSPNPLIAEHRADTLYRATATLRFLQHTTFTLEPETIPGPDTIYGGFLVIDSVIKALEALYAEQVAMAGSNAVSADRRG